MELREFLEKYIKLENVDETDEWVNSLCPTHDERRRSFGVSKKYLICKCYVCGKKPLHKLLQEVRGISKAQALGIIRKDLNRNYKSKNWSTTGSHNTKELIRKRKLREIGDELKYFSFQYSKYLTRQKGFDKSYLEMFKVFYNDEEQRILFPIYEKKKLVGMMYRNPYDEGGYWYNEGFDRQIYVYNIDNICRGSMVYVVESPKDVVWLCQCGVDTAVAVFGTNFGPEQVRKIKKRTNKVCLVMDNDEAGQRAQGKLFKAFKGCIKYSIDMDGYKDPGDMPKNVVVDRFTLPRLCFKV